MEQIVVGVDGSEAAGHALRWAAREAQLRGHRLVALLACGFLDQHHTIIGERFDPHEAERQGLEALDGWVTRALGHDAARAVERRAVCDLAAPVLLDAANGASLLVVGARGLGGFRGLLMGSVSQRCLHQAACPVAVVRHELREAGDRAERIVVGVDASETARRALHWALEEARLRGAAVEVVHAWHVPYAVGLPFMVAPCDATLFEETARKTLDAAIAGAHSSGLQVPVEGTLVTGTPALAVLEAAKGADLIVVGSRGIGAFGGLVLGSTSNQISHHADCPLVVVPPESQVVIERQVT